MDRSGLLDYILRRHLRRLRPEYRQQREEHAPHGRIRLHLTDTWHGLSLLRLLLDAVSPLKFRYRFHEPNCGNKENCLGASHYPLRDSGDHSSRTHRQLLCLDGVRGVPPGRGDRPARLLALPPAIRYDRADS